MDKTKRTVDADINSLHLSIAHLENRLRDLSERLEPISMRTPTAMPNDPSEPERSEIGSRIHEAERIISRCAFKVHGMINDLDLDKRTDVVTCKC